jgi:nucleoside 2-deoxyribosyltransferase
VTRIYLAGPLFTEAERRFNVELADRLGAAGHAVYLPQRDAPAPAGDGYPTRIFRANLEGLEAAEALVAVCDGVQVDDGTAWEIGWAYARGVPVYGLRTDPRSVTAQERINLTIEQCLATLAASIEELLAKLN